MESNNNTIINSSLSGRLGEASRIVILGGGESGAGAAVLAKKQGFDVFLSDLSEIKPQYKSMLNQY